MLDDSRIFTLAFDVLEHLQKFHLIVLPNQLLEESDRVDVLVVVGKHVGLGGVQLHPTGLGCHFLLDPSLLVNHLAEFVSAVQTLVVDLLLLYLDVIVLLPHLRLVGLSQGNGQFTLYEGVALEDQGN